VTFSTLYCDPPWSYRNKRTGGSLKSGAGQRYPTMTVDELCALPVAAVLDRNAVCFLWATMPLLPDALRVLDAWGFTYRTSLFWDKDRLGLGFWFRGQVEVLLVGTRGKVKPPRIQERNLVKARALAHSEKPEVFRVLAEMAVDSSRLDSGWLELFARRTTLNLDVRWVQVGFDLGLDVREWLVEQLPTPPLFAGAEVA